MPNLSETKHYLMKHYFRRFASGAQTAVTLITPASGLSIKVYGYEVSTGGTANSIQLRLPDDERGSDTTNFRSFELAANGGANVASSYPISKGNTNAVLSVTSSADTVLSIAIDYIEEPRGGT